MAIPSADTSIAISGGFGICLIEAEYGTIICFIHLGRYEGGKSLTVLMVFGRTRIISENVLGKYGQ